MVDKGYPKGCWNLISLMVRYLLIMALAGLAVGVVYREFSKAYLSGFSLEDQIVVSYYLSLSHGHVFFVGVLLPVALLAVTYVMLQAGKIPESRACALKKPFTIFVIGSLLMIGLLIYKGLGIVYAYSLNPGAGLTAADQTLFLGSKVLRESLYGIAHLLMGIGLTWYAVSLMRNAK